MTLRVGRLSTLVVGLVGGAAVLGAIPVSSPTSTFERLYSDDSPFNQKIAVGAPIDSKSAHMIGSLVRAGRKQGFLIALKRWTIPIYYASADTPRYRVRMTAKWAPASWFEGVPIPDGAAPDPAADGHMVIIDRDTGCEYDFWRAKKRKSGKWRASWGNSLRTDGDGIFPRGLSARGSGFALPAGMIFPDELVDGRIDHALQFSYDYPKRGGPVEPATESDGHSRRSDAIPEGARLRLDPTLELDSLGLTRYERIIAEALQQYGMILADNGGGVELHGRAPDELRRRCLCRRPAGSAVRVLEQHSPRSIRSAAAAAGDRPRERHRALGLRHADAPAVASQARPNTESRCRFHCWSTTFCRARRCCIPKRQR